MGFKTHLTRDSLCPSQKGLTISPTEHHLALGCTQRCLHLPCADASVRAEHFVPLSRKAAAQPTNSHSPSVWDPQQCCAWLCSAHSPAHEGDSPSTGLLPTPPKPSPSSCCQLHAVSPFGKESMACPSADKQFPPVSRGPLALS